MSTRRECDRCGKMVNGFFKMQSVITMCGLDCPKHYDMCELCWKLFHQEVEADQYLVDDDNRSYAICDVHMGMWRNSHMFMEDWLKDKGLA